MSETVGLVSFPEEDKTSVRPYSKSLAALVDEEVRRIVAKAYLHTEKVLKENSDKLELVSVY